MTAGPAPHPDLGPLARFLGTFEGDGHGDYPTIEPFGYREQVTFTHVGKPFLAYGQRTRHPATGAPMHAETGYLRRVLGREHDLELVLAHPTGIVEVQQGSLVEADGALRLELASTLIGRTATAKDVRTLRRSVTLTGDLLVYDLFMAHEATPETHHLHAELHRTA